MATDQEMFFIVSACEKTRLHNIHIKSMECLYLYNVCRETILPIFQLIRGYAEQRQGVRFLIRSMS